MKPVVVLLAALCATTSAQAGTRDCVHTHDVDWNITLDPDTNYGSALTPQKHTPNGQTDKNGRPQYDLASPINFEAKTYSVLSDFADPGLDNVCKERGRKPPEEMKVFARLVRYYGVDVGYAAGDSKYSKAGKLTATVNGETRSKIGRVGSPGSSFDHDSGGINGGKVAVGGTFDVSAVLELLNWNGGNGAIQHYFTLSPELRGRTSGTVRYYTDIAAGSSALAPASGNGSTAVPLPAGGALMIGGLLALAGVRKRRRGRG
ncbi:MULTISPECIES: hypothetical protein [unclassified Meridianimarinicoccus]|uniref:hypothetical protein n=1 Tax=unclassified Meridianimarinicoccus TaxID=2923344 RepID=UPI00186823B9|nr:hypothetical protein [Fluviibacterium sp. MJW13]